MTETMVTLPPTKDDNDNDNDDETLTTSKMEDVEEEWRKTKEKEVEKETAKSARTYKGNFIPSFDCTCRTPNTKENVRFTKLLLILKLVFLITTSTDTTWRMEEGQASLVRPCLLFWIFYFTIEYKQKFDLDFFTYIFKTTSVSERNHRLVIFSVDLLKTDDQV